MSDRPQVSGGDVQVQQHRPTPPNKAMQHADAAEAIGQVAAHRAQEEPARTHRRGEVPLHSRDLPHTGPWKNVLRKLARPTKPPKVTE